jgi:hypothetical protein
MQSIATINPLVRAIGVISAVAILVTGITMAAFTTNTVAIEGSTLTAATDTLQIWNGTSFGTDPAPGFDVSLSPGTESEKQPFYLKNTSGSELNIAVSATATVTDIDATGVEVKFYNDAQPTNSEVLVTTLAALIAAPEETFNAVGTLNGGAEGNGGIPGTNGNYHVTFKLASSAITGAAPAVTDLNLMFTGTSIEP